MIDLETALINLSYALQKLTLKYVEVQCILYTNDSMVIKHYK